MRQIVAGDIRPRQGEGGKGKPSAVTGANEDGMGAPFGIASDGIECPAFQDNLAGLGLDAVDIVAQGGRGRGREIRHGDSVGTCERRLAAPLGQKRARYGQLLGQ